MRIDNSPKVESAVCALSAFFVAGIARAARPSCRMVFVIREVRASV
jgi:hypothetical protein